VKLGKMALLSLGTSTALLFTQAVAEPATTVKAATKAATAPAGVVIAPAFLPAGVSSDQCTQVAYFHHIPNAPPTFQIEEVQTFCSLTKTQYEHRVAQHVADTVASPQYLGGKGLPCQVGQQGYAATDYLQDNKAHNWTWTWYYGGLYGPGTQVNQQNNIQVYSCTYCEWDNGVFGAPNLQWNYVTLSTDANVQTLITQCL